MERNWQVMALFVLGFINGDQFIQHICIYSRALYNRNQPCINRNYFFADHVHYHGPYFFKRTSRVDEVIGNDYLPGWYTFPSVKRKLQ